MEQPKQPKDAQKEIELQLSELEDRVDRLRALYEQYFMGYEKLEPSVPRKDVDRRFMLLRKIQLRNTAVRFRFNVITQKFNTYAMYWTRVCRQIEEGTFKRHIQKAKRRFGDEAEAKKPKLREEEGSSIDVDLGDFEDEEPDLDAILREADAAAVAYGNAASDTLPPAAPSEKPPALAQPRTEPLAFRPAGAVLRPRAGTEPLRTLAATADIPVPGPSSTSFALRGGRESIGVPESRPMRAAALPPGAKPKLLVRRGDGPESTSSQVRPPMPSQPEAPLSSAAPQLTPAMRPRAPSIADSERTPAPSVSRVPASTPSTSSIRTTAVSPTMPTPQVYRPAARPASMESTGRIVARPAIGVSKMPVALPHEDRASPSVSTPASPMTPRPVPSSTRMPTAPIDPSMRPMTGIIERQPLAPPSSPAPTRRPPPPLPSAGGKIAKKP